MLRSEPISLLSGSCTELQAMCKPCLLSAEEEEEERKQPSGRRAAVKMAERRIHLLLETAFSILRQSVVTKPKCCCPIATNGKMWAFFLSSKHSDYIQSARPTLVPVPIQINGWETKRCQYIPKPGRLHPRSRSSNHRAAGAVLCSSQSSFLPKDVLLYSL